MPLAPFSECESRIVAPVSRVVSASERPHPRREARAAARRPAHRLERIAVDRLEDPCATARALNGGSRLLQ
jgi:hypothetical protein